jgi:hypothetical protein
VIIVLTVAPARTGPPNPARSVAAPPAAGAVFRTHLIASPFGTIHAATFRFSPPVGTEVPAFPGFHLAAYVADGDAALTPSYGDDDLQREFPHIDRSRKGARLAPARRPDPDAPLATAVEGARENRDLPVPPASARPGDSAMSGRVEAGHAGPGPDSIPPSLAAARESTPPADSGSATIRMAGIYLVTTSPTGLTPVALEPWPVDVWEALPVASWPAEIPGSELSDASPAADRPSGPPLNETVAAKGEVTGAGRRPKSPAELLDLAGASRARHEKCLADAIYFEARGEPVRGQMAVAQVVINRVFSGHYPDNVCGVVYQSTRRHRRLRCQFSFTCDGIPDRVTEPDAWERATHIARDALDGRFWLNDIGKATHYHARWVYPRWVHEMRRLDRIGVHTFYRPRRWGDGAGSPVWGDASAKVEKL